MISSFHGGKLSDKKNEEQLLIINFKIDINMKKKIRVVMMVAAVALVAGINVFNSRKSDVLSDVALANVEALAVGEDINPECPNGCVNGGGGCYCYHKYADYREAPW